MSWILAFLGFAVLIILHELGHYFGLDEGRLEELGYTRARPERREPGYGKGGMSFG